jgi:hypothetical protein
LSVTRCRNWVGSTAGAADDWRFRRCRIGRGNVTVAYASFHHPVGADLKAWSQHPHHHLPPQTAA